MAIQTATNSETGEVVALVDGQWLPVTQTAFNDKKEKAYLVNNQWMTDEPIAPPVKQAGFSLGDIAKSLGIGAAGSTKALTDVAGADNFLSAKLGRGVESLQKSLTLERQAELERQDARMKAAEESGSFLQEIKAGALNVAEAPLQSAAQAIGSFAPYLPALFAAPAFRALGLFKNSISRIEAVAAQAPKLMGTAQGAGAVKGAIYDGVLQAEMEAGVDPDLAKQKADAAQSYFGGNFDQIALGGGLGFLAGSTGVEKFFTPLGRSGAAPGLGRRVAGAALSESLPEAAQGGQERLAQNIALQREGFDVDTFKGVAGAATQEALTGALGAVPIAALVKPEVKPLDNKVPEERDAFAKEFGEGTPVDADLTSDAPDAISEPAPEPIQLPGGFTVTQRELSREDVPEAFGIFAEGSDKPLSTVSTQADAETKLTSLSEIRQEEQARLLKETDTITKSILSEQRKLDVMEATGQTDTDEYVQAKALLGQKEEEASVQIEELNNKIASYAAPLTLAPIGVKTNVQSDFVATRGTEVIGTFPTFEVAESTLRAAEPEVFKQADIEARTLEVKNRTQQVDDLLRPMFTKFNLGDVGLNVVEEIKTQGGALADGSYARNLIQIAMDIKEPIKVMRHETVHALKELGFFTPQQYKALTERAEKQWIKQYLEGSSAEVNGVQMSRLEAYKELAKGRNLTPEQLQEEIAEEAIADAFGAYDRGETPPPGLIATLYKKLKNFFMNFGQALRGAGFESSEDIFDRIERGELKSSKPKAVKAEPKEEAQETAEKLSLKTVKDVINDGVDRLVKTARKGRIKENQDRFMVGYARANTNLTKVQDGIEKRLMELGVSTKRDERGDRELDTVIYGKVLPAYRAKLKELEGVRFGEEKYSLPTVKSQQPVERTYKESDAKLSVRNKTKGLLNPSIEPRYEKIINGVVEEMGLTPEEFASTSLIFQTGKAGTEQFETDKIGGLPEVVQFLQDQRRGSGLPLLDVDKPEDRKIIAKLMATEAMAAIRTGAANLEWYDSIINKTLAMAGLKYSELNTDINARMAFRIATAITSQGLNVEDNLAFAMTVYDQFRKNGKFPEVGQGADQGAMVNNFKFANYLMDDLKPNMMRQFLETEFTVEELRSAGFNIAGELGDEKVLGSSVFGPKIGFGFYSNLNGNFDPVTMDMWFMRTIGRLTGKLKSFRQDLYDAQLDKFREALNIDGSNGVFANQFDQNEVELAKVDDEAAKALARKVKSAHERDYKVNRAGFDDGTREKSKLVAVSETMIKSLDAPKDAPANGSERRNLRDVVRQMVNIVEEKYGKRVPPASLQAVIWYPEQELYKAMGVKLRVTSQSYAGAMEKILKGEGYGESELSAASKLGSRTAQQLAKSAVAKRPQTAGAEPVRLGPLQAGEKESLLERGRKRVVLTEEKETPKRKRVIFEVAPDPNNKQLTAKWKSLTSEERIEISDKIGNKIIKIALDKFGLKGYVDTQVGSYLDDTNPSFALYLDSGDSVAIANFLGYALSQDSMVVMSPKPAKGLDKTGSVRIKVGDLDAEDVDRIYQKLREITVDGEKPVGGQSYMNGHMVVLNYSNVPTKQLAALIEKKLGKDFKIIIEDVYTAFPEKKDYNYDNPSSDPKGNAGVLRQASRDTRSEAARLLQKELATLKPKAAAETPKLSLRTAFPSAKEAEDAAYKKAAPETREFKLFFGGSQIKDEGRPQVMYHGSASEFTTFLEDKPIFVSPEAGFAEQFAEDRAKDEGKSTDEMRIYPLFVRAETPFDYENKEHAAMVTEKIIADQKLSGPDSVVRLKKSTPKASTFKKEIAGGLWSVIEDPIFQDALKSFGFDSFYVKEYGNKNLAVFSANQVKSVTGNIGEFGRESKDMRFSLPTIPTAITDRVNETTFTRERKNFAQRMVDAITPESASAIRAAFLNRYNQMSVQDKKLAEQMGGPALLADQSSESAALMSDLGAGIAASAMGMGNRNGGIPVLRNGITTIDTSVKGMIASMAPLASYGDPKVYQYYQYWAMVKRGQRLDKQGKLTGITTTDVAFAKNLEAKFPEFVSVQKDLIAFNNGLVKYMVDTGVLSQQNGAEFVKYADYIPFYRQMDGQKTLGPNLFQSLSGVKPPKKLKGAVAEEAPLADFLETMVRNTQSAIQAGIKNYAGQRAMNVAVQLTAPGMGATRLNTVSKAPNVINVLEKGLVTSYETPDTLLIEAVKSLNLSDLPFMGILSAPADLLRNLVTKDPGFMMANLLRDSLSAYVTSGVKMTPVAGTVINFGKALARTSPGFEALLNAGIIGGYEFSANIEQSGRNLEDDLSKKAGKKDPILFRPFTSLWGALETGTTASDAATRALIYERVLADTGNEAEALFRSLEVMNFHRKGSSALIRVLTAAVPFFNARLQGLDLFYRASTGNMNNKDAAQIQRQFFVRGLTMMALSGMYYFMVSDDEEYKKQEQETKDNNWLIPSLGIRIPIPFEVGVLFKTIPERIAAYVFGNDTGEDLRNALFRSAVGTFAFNPIPQTVKPIVEAAFDINTFTFRPIVSEGMKDVDPQFQVGPGTSSAAKGIAGLLGLSPMKVDHILKGYTGTIGMYAIDTMDAVMDQFSDSPKATKRFEQLPIIKRFTVDPEARGNVTEYYKLKDSVDTVVRTMNFLEKQGESAEYVEYLKKNQGTLAFKDYIRDTEKTMKELRQAKSAVQISQMSGDEKRDAITNINRAESAINSEIQRIKKIIASAQ